MSHASSLLLALLVYLAWSWWSKNTSNRRLPPGPRPIPFLGNVHQLPSEFQHKTFSEWGKQYGDLVFAQLFQSKAIIVNSLRVAQDLLERRSAVASDRPPMSLLNDVLGWDSDFGFMRYGERWRMHRKWTHLAFETQAALQSYAPIQYRERAKLLSALLKHPKDYREHIERFAAALIMEVAYGYTLVSDDDEFFRRTRHAIQLTVDVGSAAASLIDFFPILKHVPAWLPGAGFMRDALAARKAVREHIDIPYDAVKNDVISGQAKSSFVSALIAQHLKDDTLTPNIEEDIKGGASGLYIAAAETTATVLTTFILAMVLHPKVYKKAQDEIDRVVGNSRLPDLGDRDSLPYIECVIKELFRWNSPTPLGLPHALTENQEYNGYSLPGGATIFTNIWQMTQDAEFYPEPEKFRPERFQEMDIDTAKRTDPRRYIFGFGRRICPGRHFADTNVWFGIASIVATLDICKARDINGNEITPRIFFPRGMVSAPEPFICEIRPRQGRPAEALILQALSSTDA
ncbi:cytochrome P450 [Wolfiporia cocos MD-104 SS10]|uniref:Cytochrome P450 n=1 Tax=Wolfiporia cocos (strain MD-104) TaxID=742152 RepID=A0A2H3JMZ0_WOLCO|nr:cytochrome P450 [Wolfiporia cocos MD-104 SS10]